jgi:prepilin-type N-terminal cleavage/methylation domain-containing protein
MRRLLHKKKGYTLIELLVYVVIFSIVAAVVINGIILSMTSFATARVHRKLASAGLDTLERMTRETREALAVDAAGSTLDVSPGVLSLTVRDDEGDIVTQTWSIVDNALTLTEDSVVLGSVLDEDVAVINFVVREISTARSTAVKIELTLEHTVKVSQTVDFFTTVGLRGSY